MLFAFVESPATGLGAGRRVSINSWDTSDGGATWTLRGEGLAPETDMRLGGSTTGSGTPGASVRRLRGAYRGGQILLVDRPGFVTDPVFDLSTSSIIHAHCVAATQMEGPRTAPAPYIMRTHMEDNKGVSLQVPEGGVVALLGGNGTKMLDSTGLCELQPPSTAAPTSVASTVRAQQHS